jgi:hypothetical protein
MRVPGGGGLAEHLGELAVAENDLQQIAGPGGDDLAVRGHGAGPSIIGPAYQVLREGVLEPVKDGIARG